ncbi:hypothetical protein HAZT_HAZT005155 [Hyalella azteca]|uniref:F-box only protein 42 n=1 Tax=Hyalella azteca TaxID=294128 RepID=A0A6A0GYQ2_HYAAZ|nr:F-box only protein 42 [Hyalella azteca]XP_018013218.1 F-box only protein 42 [Hyalella azteca]KAA0192141.1 hypothetical protein HAZT_HAZT005155 [Hyalella azteca]
MASIDDLPNVILEYILGKVSPYGDIKACSMVCSRWHQCCQRVAQVMKTRFQSAVLNGPLGMKIIPACPTSSFASSRMMQSACVVESDLYLFGGCTSALTTFNDLWRINLQSGKINLVHAIPTSTVPSPKSHLPLVSWNGHLILFGGWASPCPYPLHQSGILFDELHCFNIDKNIWIPVDFPGKPPAVAGHTATVHGDVIVFFGGFQNNGQGIHVSSNSVTCLDMKKGKWLKPRISYNSPPPRYGHSQFKLDEKHVIIMSGCGGYNDLHCDYWMLTIPSDIRSSESWEWRRLREEQSDYMPKKLWCSPSCQVDDNIVVLSYESHITSKVTLPAAGHVAAIGRVECTKAPMPEPPVVSHFKPSVRPNANNHRELRKSLLDKHSIRLQLLSNSNAAQCVASPGSSQRIENVGYVKPSCRQGVYILSLKNVLSDGVVRWLPGPTCCFDNDPPHPRLLSSLVLGKAELILCGGKKARECDCDPDDPIPPIVYLRATALPPP